MQTLQFEEAALAYRLHLEGVALAEALSSRRELQYMHDRVDEASAQQRAQALTLENMLVHIEQRGLAVREGAICLRQEGEGYARMLEHAKQSWQNLHGEMVVSTQREALQRNEVKTTAMGFERSRAAARGIQRRRHVGR